MTILEQTPVSDNIAIASSVFYGTCPAYLTNIVEAAGAGRTRSGLRSTSFTDYKLPRLRTKFAERAFSYAGPSAWNCRKICVPWLIQPSSENTWKLTSSLQPIMFTGIRYRWFFMFLRFYVFMTLYSHFFSATPTVYAITASTWRTAIWNCASTRKSFASLDALSFFFVRFDQNFVRQIRCDAA